MRTPKELFSQFLHAANTNSFRAAVELYNHDLDKESKPLAVMTLNDNIARHGTLINQAEVAHATEIFLKFGLDANGNIVDNSRLHEILGDQPPTEIADVEELSKALHLELGLEPGEEVRADTFSRHASKSLEYLANSVLVSLDGVLTKLQKQHRKIVSDDDGSTVGSGKSRSLSWPKHETDDSPRDANAENKHGR